MGIDLAIQLSGTMSSCRDSEVVQRDPNPDYGALVKDLSKMELHCYLVSLDDLSDCSTYMYVNCNLQASRHWLPSMNV